MTRHAVHQAAELGQSLWYDFIRRDLVGDGTLARLVADDGLLGMTSNPTIFEKAIGGGALYDESIRAAAKATLDPLALFEAVAIDDVRAACDVFRPVWEARDGLDGFVSLEVSPRLAHDGAATAAEAKRLWAAVDRPNLMIKIPGTAEGLSAITAALADGINVNVTLLFSVERHGEVIDAFFAGLEARAAAGKPIARVASVASFFVSRVDTAVDPLLKASTVPGAADLVGRIAIDNARLAYALFEERFASPRWKALAAKGAAVQRPLWASTSMKDPARRDVLYVEELIAPDSVNTVPPETFDAFRDHGRAAIRIREDLAGARERIAALPKHGVDLPKVLRELEADGVKKFAASFDQLLGAVAAKGRELGG